MTEKYTTPTDLTLSGQLVILRPSNELDYPSLQKIFSDPKTMNSLKFMSFSEQGGWTYELIRNRLEERKEEQKAQKTIQFTIHDISTDTVLGTCSLTHIDSTHNNAVFGMILHYPYWGTGIAAESHLLTLGYAFDTLKFHRIEFGTLVTNQRMRGFFDKVGIKLESIKKDYFYENSQYVDEAIYVILENYWPDVKNKLQEQINLQSKTFIK